ncbi:AMP-binding protein [Phenylobacterium montanum]|uniref:AMP-binding protein n=1 Tax=Phenylobacterium montanum TaxID=2823693 RepID=A0A975IUU7_9CAUL|nr:AMP-binding protein [Caulobacter sp. S6]QUD86626.1 AMP-binding protein [Caulobacter sp. S6]
MDAPVDAGVVAELAMKGMLSSLYAAIKPDGIAVVAPRGKRTFAELHAGANRLAAALRRAGLGPGDHIALLCPNTPEFVEVLAANLRSGTRLTPINWHLSPTEVAYIVADCQAKAFIAHADFAAAALASVTDRLQLKLAIGGAIEGFGDYAAALAAEQPDDPPEPVHGGTMMYTSGTTGRPKGVFRAKPIIVPPAWGPGTLKGYERNGDVNLCCGPGYHAAPLAFDVTQPLNAGITIALMEKFDPEAWLKAVEAHRVTHVHMVSTMFQRLLALPEAVRRKYDLSSLRFVLHGAAPTPPEVKRAMIEWLGPILYEYYAASEGGGNFYIDSAEWLAKPGSVGRLDPAFGTRIIGEDGRDCAPGEIGAIYFQHSPVARFEYFNDPGKTQEATLDGGTHFTVGDMGYVDEDGYLFLTGRTAECIISGGVNIYPQEIDNELVKHPAVLDVCTIGVPDDEWGEAVKSVVSLRDGHAPSDDLARELIAFARERLAHYKTPKSIDFAADIPRSEAGKVQRRQVRAPYWAGRVKQI